MLISDSAWLLVTGTLGSSTLGEGTATGADVGGGAVTVGSAPGRGTEVGSCFDSRGAVFGAGLALGSGGGAEGSDVVSGTSSVVAAAEPLAREGMGRT